jgi:hypothetical protein
MAPSGEGIFSVPLLEYRVGNEFGLVASITLFAEFYSR